MSKLLPRKRYIVQRDLTAPSPLQRGDIVESDEFGDTHVKRGGRIMENVSVSLDEVLPILKEITPIND